MEDRTGLDDTAVADINSLADVAPALRELGYTARPTDDGVLVKLVQAEEDGSRREFLMMITESDGNLEFNCELCTIGELEKIIAKDHEEKDQKDALMGIILNFLALNTEIQPWAVGLINPDGVLDETDVVVLTDSEPLGDFSPEELEKEMGALERALAAVTPTYIK